MKKLKHFNPIVSDVIDQFDTVELMTRVFTNTTNGSATRGLLISGDAGMGKTYFAMKGLYSSVDPSNIEYIKGSSISAAALYVKLFLCREAGKVLVLDDVDIIHKTAAELNTILDLLKGATEMTTDERTIAWERVASNPLMKEYGVPTSFVFNGSVVWITNDTISDIEKRCKGHWPALSSRMTQVLVRLDDHQKLQYTLYLLTEQDMLGVNCNTHVGGYSEDIINQVIDYVRVRWQSLREVTPRMVAKIADTMHIYPNHWEVIVENSMVKK
jgi:hypothetical protein